MNHGRNVVTLVPIAKMTLFFNWIPIDLHRLEKCCVVWKIMIMMDVETGIILTFSGRSQCMDFSFTEQSFLQGSEEESCGTKRATVLSEEV